MGESGGKTMNKWTFHKFNFWYDSISDFKRFGILILWATILLIVPTAIWKQPGFLAGMGIFCISALYRIDYTRKFAREY